MSAPTTAQMAVADTLETAEEDVEKMRAEYDRRRRLIVNGFNELGLACFEPRGAFYAFPNIAATGMDEHAFAETLLKEEHVAVIPGRRSGRPARASCARVTRPPTTKSKRRWSAFIISCSGTARPYPQNTSHP